MKRKRLKMGILILIVGLAVIVFALAGRNADNVERHQPGSIEVETEEHSTEEEAEKTEISADAVTVDAEEWQTMVLEALDCADMQAETSITSENEMTISGDLPKETITNWLNAADEDAKGMYQSILSILPETLPTSLTCEIGSADGKVQLSGVSMTVADIDVPMDVLDGVWSSVNDNLNQSLDEKIGSVSAVHTEDGAVILEP